MASEKNEAGVWEKVSYTWKICEMDSHIKKETGHKLVSARFSTKHGDNYVWNIQFYPTGETELNSDFFSIFLNAVKIPKDVETKFTFSIRDSGDRVIKTLTGPACFSPGGYGRGWPSFVKQSDVLSVVKDNIIKIYAEILMKICNPEIKDFIVSLDSNFPEVKLQQSMAGLLESGKFSDVEFHADEKIFQLHKSILSARSPVFEAMFSHDTIESQSGVVIISDFDGENFKRFLSFIYSGKVDIISTDVAIELFKAAEKYDFPGLKLQCENYIASNLNSNNIGPVLVFTEIFDTKDLKQKGMNYILENCELFSNAESEAYKLFEKQCPKLLSELLALGFQKLVLQNSK